MPFIYYPNVCMRCGELDPPQFQVMKREWEYNVSPSHRKGVLCRRCYDEIEALVGKR